MKLPRLIQHLPVLILAGPARFSWWTLYPYSSYWRRGGHEPEIAAAIRSLGDLTNKTVWDMGAHFGIHTLGFSKLVGPFGQVAAFEPDPASFERMRLHLRMNRTANTVLIPAGASDRTTSQTLVLNQGVGATTSHVPYPGEQLDSSSRTLLIECVSADELVVAGRIRFPDIIKLDVEGHGGEALAGARSAIQTSKPLIIASTHSPQEAAAIRAVLQPIGYECGRVGARPVTEALAWDDFQSGANYLLQARG